MSVETGGPAFPLNKGKYNESLKKYDNSYVVGMTVLDYLAGEALVGILASRGPEDMMIPHNKLAIEAYSIALEMVKIRKDLMK